MRIKRIVTIITALVMAFTVFAMTPDTASAKSSKYWLKVNTKANVVNVYRLNDEGKWKPIKVMLCSCGKPGHSTPKGTYSIKKKWRWQRLFYGVSGQYVSQFKGNYLFHSVVYSKYGRHDKCVRKEYNKLGKAASHGCVRLATMDAKWIYEKCGRGTKVTIYKSSDPGPLGKPEKVEMSGKGKYGWDPTDKIKRNKKFKMTGPEITINKDSEIIQGKTFKIKKGVKAISPYTFQSLTHRITIASVKFRAKGKEKYVTVSSKKVDTNKLGTYKIKYSCYSTYCGRYAVTKTFRLKVVAPPEPDEPKEDAAKASAPNPAVSTDSVTETPSAEITEPSEKTVQSDEDVTVEEEEPVLDEEEIPAEEEELLPPSEEVYPEDEILDPEIE